jgi:hypothetical protein
LKIADHEIPLYSFDLPRRWPGEAAPARPVMIFSDREFYRPNETLHLKALARDWTRSGLAVPTGLAGTLECFDVRGKSFFSNKVQFSACGAFSADVLLPAGPCGGYVAHFHLGDSDYAHGFQVAEFQPNPFEVSVQARPEYAAGDKVEIPVSAHYYFGQPLSRARVQWTMEVDEGGFRPKGFESFTFLGVSRGSHLAVSGKTRMANSNGCVITPEMPSNNVAPGLRFVSLLVETTDLDQQTVSSSVQFTWHSSDFYLGLCQTNLVWTAGREAPLQIVAVGADAKPWPQPVAAHLQPRRFIPTCSSATLKSTGRRRSTWRSPRRDNTCYRFSPRTLMAARRPVPWNSPSARLNPPSPRPAVWPGIIATKSAWNSNPTRQNTRPERRRDCWSRPLSAAWRG